MKRAFVAVALLVLSLHGGQAAHTNPIKKVLQLLLSLEAKIKADHEQELKLFNDFAEYCEDRSRKLGFEIKTGKAEVEELQATIFQQNSAITVLTSKIEELSGEISSDEADMKAATRVRKAEKSDFGAEEKNLQETIDTLERAISILTKEMAKHGASMLQLKNAKDVTEAFDIMIKASAMRANDASMLTALVQQGARERQQDADGEDDYELGAPAGSKYEAKGDSIITQLEGLLGKADSQLEKVRDEEKKAAHSYDMVKQSLSDEIDYATKDMTAAKKDLAEAQEKKSVAEGDLEVTKKDLAGDVSSKAALHHECMSRATEYELSTKSRAEELKAIESARKIIQETTGAASKKTYGFIEQPMSLLQKDQAKQFGSGGLAKIKAMRLIRDLANKEGSASLAQLASKMSSAFRLSSDTDADPFRKTKGLIANMVAKLEAEAAEEADHKSYCDKELSETSVRKEEKSTEAEKITTRIDQRKAMSTKLKEATATLQKELTSIQQSMAKSMKIRQEEKAVYDKSKVELESALRGTQMALNAIKNYYGAQEEKDHKAAEGSATTLIGMLEVIESDFTKGLAELTAEEESAAREFDELSKATQVEVAAKTKDIKYKTREFKSLDKIVSEFSSDLSGVNDERGAIQEYDNKIKKMCTAKAEPYAERAKRRKAEIKGLKEALGYLEGESSLLQKRSFRTLRGGRAHSRKGAN